MLVQLDDGLVEQLDSLAASQGVSRSELIRRAAAALIEAAAEADALSRAIASYTDVPDEPSEDEVLLALATETMRGLPW